MSSSPDLSQSHASSHHPVGLAIHTASPELGLALATANGELKSQCWDLGRSLSAELHLHLSHFVQPLAWSEFHFLAVAKGPGGFTGTRMGVVTSRTLAQQLQLPLIALSTLMVLAWDKAQHLGADPAALVSSADILDRPDQPDQAHQQDAKSEAASTFDIAVEMPARRGAVYGAIYRFTLARPPESSSLDTPIDVQLSLPETVYPDAAIAIDTWHQQLSTWPHPYHHVTADSNLGRFALPLLTLAQLYIQQGDRPHWSEALPFYGQSPV